MPDKAKQLQIKQVFRTLRNNEAVGINIKASTFKNQKIHDRPIPQEYEHAVLQVWLGYNEIKWLK